MSNPAKMLRSQLRAVVNEVLPDLIKDEKQAVLYKELSDQLNKRVDHLTKVIKETLDMIDQRSKDIQGYVVRQSAGVASVSSEQPVASEVSPNEKA